MANNARSPEREDSDQEYECCWAIILLMFLTANRYVCRRWQEESSGVDLRSFARLVQMETNELIKEVNAGWARQVLLLASRNADWLEVAEALRGEAAR